MSASLQVGADIGGTFTDIAIEDGTGRWSVKVPTTHAAPENGVMDGIARGLRLCGRPLSDVSLLVHGTTLATNALIERKGVKTALVTTAGFRDVLEMGNEGRFDQYDLRAVKPTSLVPRHLRFTVAERIRHNGSVVLDLDTDDVARVAEDIRRADVKGVAVAFLHAYADGTHERRTRDVLARVLGGVPISLSHEVSPEMREYDRVSTTCANAYLQPVVSQYLLNLEERLKAGGFRGPLLLMLSSGGLTTVRTASDFPIRLLESGPAGGAIFACDVARRLGLSQVLSLDVGGTTAKFCMIENGEARQSLSFEVGRTYRFKKGSGIPIRVPVVDLVEIGAGGGSIAGLDAVSRVAVGPRSAGSEPGPACYGRGGLDATVTDCDLVLGKLDAAAFAGGSFPLDLKAATTAIDLTFRQRTGLSVKHAAAAVAETMTEVMAAAARVHANEVGADFEGRVLIAFGGAAPLHAARFAEKLGLSHVVIPRGAGVGSAIGFLRAPVAFEIARTILAPVEDGPMVKVGEALEAMEAEAIRVVGLAGPLDGAIIRQSAQMRYVGQGHDIEVAFQGHAAEAGFGRSLVMAFEGEYARIYGQALTGKPVEATGWAVKVQQPLKRASAASSATPAPDRHAAEPLLFREVFDLDALAIQDWPEFQREQLSAGAEADGPAIISEAETTTIVPQHFRFSIDTEGLIHLRRWKVSP